MKTRTFTWTCRTDYVISLAATLGVNMSDNEAWQLLKESGDSFDEWFSNYVNNAIQEDKDSLLSDAAFLLEYVRKEKG